MNYIAIEKYKLYYFMPNYWRKRLRVCDYCSKRNNIQSGKVNFTCQTFDKSWRKKYWHANCYFYSSSKEEL